jgi:hypothetical protein
MPLRTLAKRCKRLTPLLAAPAALLLNQGQAKAVLTYNIFESAGNVVLQTSGSLNLTGITPIGTTSCGADGIILAPYAVTCSGPENTTPATVSQALHSSTEPPLSFPRLAYLE